MVWLLIIVEESNQYEMIVMNYDLERLTLSFGTSEGMLLVDKSTNGNMCLDCACVQLQSTSLQSGLLQWSANQLI